MGHRQLQRSVRIERIIVASLIVDFAFRWHEVRDCVEPDMFHDPWCRELFQRITDLDEQGAPVDIVTVWEIGGAAKEECLPLFDLTMDEDYTILALDYHTRCMMTGTPKRHVTFADYVTQLIRNHDKRQLQEQ